jgi:hypothetical protein
MGTMNKRPSPVIILESFLNKEVGFTRSYMAMDASKTELNKG